MNIIYDILGLIGAVLGILVVAIIAIVIAARQNAEGDKQTRLESFVEAWVNVGIGFGINFVANLLILPFFGFTRLTLATNFVIGLIYTVISVARSYVIRRWAQEYLRAFIKRVSEMVLRKVKEARQ